MIPTRVGWNWAPSGPNQVLGAPAHLPGDLLFVSTHSDTPAQYGTPSGWNRLGDGYAVNNQWPNAFWRFADGGALDNFTAPGGSWQQYLGFMSMTVYRGLKPQAPLNGAQGAVNYITLPTVTFGKEGGIEIISQGGYTTVPSIGSPWGVIYNNKTPWSSGQTYFSDAATIVGPFGSAGGQQTSSTDGTTSYGNVVAAAFFAAMPDLPKARLIIG